jgi:hypothetical protein
MTHEKMTPLRERMIEDMRIHGMGLVARVRVWLSFPLPVDLVK